MLTLTRNHVIGQHTLVSILNQRRHIETLRKEYENARASLASQEEQVIANLEDNHGVAPGQRTASVKVFEKRIVAWKDAFVKYMGKALVEKISQETVPTLYKKLEIA